MTDRRAARLARLDRSRLYLVSGARREIGDLEPFLDEVLDAGVDIVQLREKDAEAGDLVRWSTVFRRAAAEHDALFIVNDRPDVAVAVGADGVHVGQNDLPPAWARAIVGDDMLIGLSTHSEAEFAGADAAADYLCAGPVHATPTKPGRSATGLELVRAAEQRVARGAEARPWFVIGGIDADAIADVRAAGATRAVVVRAIGEAADPAAATRALVTALRDVAAP